MLYGFQDRCKERRPASNISFLNGLGILMPIARPALAALVVFGVLSASVEAVGIGYWRYPSTPAQFCGYGVGSGHHVPMIRCPGYQSIDIQRCKYVRAHNNPFPCRDCYGGNSMCHGATHYSAPRHVTPAPTRCMGPTIQGWHPQPAEAVPARDPQASAPFMWR